MTPMPSMPAAQHNQCNMNFRQQDVWSVQAMQCMLNLWNKQNMQNMQNVPMGMANPVQSFTSMGNMPNGFNGFAVGPFPNVWTGDFQQVQGFQGMQVGFQGGNFQGAKVYAVPADQINQMGWGFQMMNQEMSTPKDDWSPSSQNSFGYGNWSELEIPEALKDFVQKALDLHGCWDLQDLIPNLSNLELKIMANQLRGHVREVVESPHGNHVLQRMLEFMAPKSLQFVLEEMLQWAPAPVLARHRYGCRVLERILEHFSEASLKPLLEDLLYHAKELCLHPFGNFVMQIFMEHAPATYRKALIEIIAQNMVQVAGDHNGCAVLERGLSYGEEAEQKILVKAILKVEGLLPSMKSLRGGAIAIERVLEIATGWALTEAQRQLSEGAAKMINKGRGRWRAQESGRNRR